MITKIDFQLTANDGKEIIYEFVGDISKFEYTIKKEFIEAIAINKVTKVLKYEILIGIWWKDQCNIEFNGLLKELINLSDILNISCYQD